MDDDLFIEFLPHEKYLILRYAASACSPEVARQLKDHRYRHIAFNRHDLDEISGELSRVVNRSNISFAEAEQLDAICRDMERHL